MLSPRYRPTSQLLRHGRRLIDQHGLAMVELTCGVRSSALRCAWSGGRLVLLAPAPTELTRRLGEALDEVGVVRIQSGRFAAGSSQDWLRVDLVGWVSRVPQHVQRAAAMEFGNRHPTTDLLDLGVGWTLLTVDVAEATVRDGVRQAVLDADSAGAWLASA